MTNRYHRRKDQRQVNRAMEIQNDQFPNPSLDREKRSCNRLTLISLAFLRACKSFKMDHLPPSHATRRGRENDARKH
jgi:hypothetical protein